MAVLLEVVVGQVLEVVVRWALEMGVRLLVRVVVRGVGSGIAALGGGAPTT